MFVLLATVCYVIVQSICCPPLRCILLPYDFRFSCVTVSAPASKKIMHQDWPCDFFWPMNYICMEWPVTHQNRGLENHSVFPPHSCLSATSLEIFLERDTSPCLGHRTRKGTEPQWFVKDMEHECKRYTMVCFKDLGVVYYCKIL